MRPSALFIAACLLCTQTSSARAEWPTAPRPYGLLRLDTLYSDSVMSSSTSPMWVQSESDRDRDPALSLHPRLSRLGLEFVRQQVASGAAVTGRAEVDFDPGGSGAQAPLRLRHVYFTLEHHGIELLAGQTDDLISPLAPDVNGDVRLWNAGNAGDRRPQLRLGYAYAGLRLAVSAGMPSAVNRSDLDQDGVLDGVDAAFPALQSRIEWQDTHVRGGTWIHYARDRVTHDARTEIYSGLMVGVHGRIDLEPGLWLQGEAFWGKNVSDVRAGVGQGIHLTLEQAVRTRGGWIEAGAQVGEVYRVSLGAGADDPRSADLADGWRDRNVTYFLSQRAHLDELVDVGLELIHWRTSYKAASIGVANQARLFLALPF